MWHLVLCGFDSFFKSRDFLMSCMSHVTKNWRKLEDLNWMEAYDIFQNKVAIKLKFVTSANIDFNNYDS